MINSRDIKLLVPELQTLCLQFIAKCKEAGVPVIITQTLRDKEYQDFLYAKGRTTPGPIVTKVKGGFSQHEKGRAFDFVPVVNGKAIWNDNKLWAKCGKIAVELGLEWGGSWTRFVDKPHCQLKNTPPVAKPEPKATIAPVTHKFKSI
jgi:peptidoglycan L-alanyl-D-glutamate endopeptidase CwlK